MGVKNEERFYNNIIIRLLFPGHFDTSTANGSQVEIGCFLSIRQRFFSRYRQAFNWALSPQVLLKSRVINRCKTV
jgi:hypothetical protein